jgi:pyridinium-3,5-bisthiocarboxylic acid mononucleotide nickel chelatase
VIGFLDLPSGLSGDMFLGCLVDAGLPVERLRAIVASLDLPAAEWSIEARGVMKGPLRATLVDVRAHEGHVHRGLADVRGILARGRLAEPVARRSLAVFERLAQAEARVHGSTPDHVHFHEVGAVDAIIDIVGAVAGIHELGIESLYAGPVPLGQGWGQSAHGPIPLPGPATLELLAAARAPTRPAPGPGEWVTPTGAALLAELSTFSEPSFVLERVAVGAGQRDCPWPNVARLLLGSETEPALVLLETNIDDMSPQLYAAVSERLFALGARDVWLTPVQMKKGRPGVVLSALCPAALETAASETILRETTTLGVRVQTLAARHEAAGRELRPVDTAYGPVRVKLKRVGSDLVAATPEYDDCAALAAARGVPLREVLDAAQAAGRALVEGLRRSTSAS